VAERLRQLGQAIELVEISTRGDVEHARPIEEIGTRGVFTREIQRALQREEVDLAVHSLKDVPTEPVDGLVLAAVPTRESAADVLVTPRNRVSAPNVGDLSHGARVGTGSLRRQAQLRHARPDLRTEDIRGNVDTRLRKLDDGQFDAIVLAEAGLRRLGLVDRVRHILPFELMLPAIGQGALAIECRADDVATRKAVFPLDDPWSHAAVLAERALLAHLRGGCMAPIGALGRIQGSQLQLSAVVLSTEGSRRIAETNSTSAVDPHGAELLGHRVAEALLSQGAADLIEAARI
jgi:hydroxymethylbilane synthase